MPHRLLQEVPGIGQQAFWIGGTTLIARKDGRAAVAVVALHHVAARRRLEMARRFATPAPRRSWLTN
jgi:hypothetical protein